MSSSSATACSRSPSPDTPESAEALDPALFESTLQSWCSTFDSGSEMWSKDPHEISSMLSKDDHQPLDFHDLIQEQMFDDVVGVDSAPTYVPSSKSPVISPTESLIHVVQMSDLLSPYHSPIVETTKPAPPPPSVSRPVNTAHEVVYPLKESCYNLPIIIPGIPESGTKSRVETQVRVTIDLAHASSSSASLSYDRVGSWKCLKLPQGTSTKKRTRKEGKLDATSQETLFLTTEVTCASPPHMRVTTCSSCQAREAKRAARKVASRVRPPPSDTDLSASDKSESGCSLIQFNCPEDLEFDTGSAVLPMRITCYCRHHREKVGFNVHFKMLDHTGRLVASGTTPPIMITDDHKSTSKTQPLPHALDPVPLDQGYQIDHAASSVKPNSRTVAAPKKRPKPYDVSGRKARREGSEDVAPHSFPPSLVGSTVPTRASTPLHILGVQQATPDASNLPSPSASFASIASPTDFVTGMYNQSDVPMPDYDQILEALDYSNQNPSLSMSIPTPPESVGSPRMTSSSLSQGPLPMYFNYDMGPTPPTLSPPKIHRLIPACGPTHGGIEVTVLGANFHAHLQLNCLFGDVMASSTQRWSDNTLLCVLPPRTTPGVVAVWFEGMDKVDDGTPPCLFTYTDESDRVLMELALQVVGLKLNGKLEDARSVAMRIIGTSGNDNNSNNSSQLDSSMQCLSTAINSVRPLLLTRAGNGQEFERLLIDFLSILDVDVAGSRSVATAVSHQAASGQTLLHLAAFLKFPELVAFLIQRGIDIDLRDRNGYTALHFAASVQSVECARVLLQAGAADDIVNVLGKTPAEVAPAGFLQDLLEGLEASEDEDEAAWGDVDEDEEIEHTNAPTRHPRALLKSPDEDDDLLLPPSLGDEKKLINSPTDKTTASIIDMIQRTLAQLQHPQGIIPNVAQLPLLQIPDLKQLAAMGAIPWNALPQMPAVFPVFVPIPGWSSLWSDKRGEGEGIDEVEKNAPRAQLRAIWEKLVQNAGNIRTDPPPPYEERGVDAAVKLVPRLNQSDADDEDVEEDEDVTPQQQRTRSSARRVNYEETHVPEQELNAYGYRPLNQNAKMQKKHDRMLVLFWIPILLIGFVWLFLQSIWASISVVKDSIPLGSWIQV